MLRGRIHSTETFGAVDGPGIRFVIFFAGCAMRCRYCHNPDTWDAKGAGERTAEELLDEAERCRAYWGKKGGITVSGGEPLLQIDFLTELFSRAKERGIHTALDTAGQPFTKEEPHFGKFRRLMDVTDLVILDLKEMDAEKHRALCGCSNENILELAQLLSDIGKPMWIRHVLVPGLTDGEEGLRALRTFTDTLSGVEKIEVLPYHSMGEEKWKRLGIPYTLAGTPVPTEESVRRAKEILGAD